MKIKTVATLSLLHLLIVTSGDLGAQNRQRSVALNRFSFDLYRETKAPRQNMFISPLSVYQALWMAYEGAQSGTREEFKKVLYLKDSGSPKKADGVVFAAPGDNYPGLSIANAVWADQTLNIKDSYRKAVSDQSNADFRQVDFTRPGKSASDINAWVAEKTNHRIDKIVSAENFSGETRLILSNAVYFNDEWLEKFDKRQTRPASFFASGEDLFTVDFMQMKEILPYYENEAFQFISKPYKSSSLSFCILLPKKLFGIEEIEKEMNSALLDRVLDSTGYAKTLLTMPKMKMESAFELTQALKKAGLTSAFSGEADFSGISQEKPLSLGPVIHKTWLALDEERTEVAAATSVIVVGHATLDAFKVFKADHPFVFFIMDNHTRAILFMGRYVQPLTGGNTAEAKENLALKIEKRQSEPFHVGDQLRETLYIVDEKIVTYGEFKAINPEEIESVKVSKNSEEIRKYAEGNYNGMVIISMKKTVK